MGTFGINKGPIKGVTPIAGIPPGFFSGVEYVLDHLEGYGCTIERNGLDWFILVNRADEIEKSQLNGGNSTPNELEPDDADGNGNVTNFTLPATFTKIIVQLAWVTITGGTGVTFGNSYNAVTTAANRFWWLDVVSTGGADTATLEKGAAFPDPPGTQNVTAPEVHSFVPIWEVKVSASAITKIVNWYAWPMLSVRS